MTTSEAVEMLRRMQEPEAWEPQISEKAFDALEMAIDALVLMRWVPVTEGMPKEDGTYIVSGVWGSGKKQVGECEYHVHDGYFDTSWDFDVEAWKSLPEPYEEEKK